MPDITMPPTVPASMPETSTSAARGNRIDGGTHGANVPATNSSGDRLMEETQSPSVAAGTAHPTAEAQVPRGGANIPVGQIHFVNHGNSADRRDGHPISATRSEGAVAQNSAAISHVKSDGVSPPDAGQVEHGTQTSTASAENSGRDQKGNDIQTRVATACGETASGICVKPKPRPTLSRRKYNKRARHEDGTHTTIGAAAGGQDGQQRNIAQGAHVALPATIHQIIEQHRQRVRLHTAEKSLTLQIKALCRRLVPGGDKKEADVLYGAMMGKKKAKAHDLAAVAMAASMPFLKGRAPLEAERESTEKQMAKLAHTLPVSPWIDKVKGMAIGSLAALVGEAGDIGSYSNPAKLWKRFGCAVMPDGTRQRKIAGAAALAHGYSPRRRSVLWNVGACILKADSPRFEKDPVTGEKTDVQIRPGGKWYALYAQRKAYEIARDPEIKPIVAHRRAQRYLDKRLLRELWKAWRDVARGVDVRTIEPNAEYGGAKWEEPAADPLKDAADD